MTLSTLGAAVAQGVGQQFDPPAPSVLRLKCLWENAKPRVASVPEMAATL